MFLNKTKNVSEQGIHICKQDKKCFWPMTKNVSEQDEKCFWPRQKMILNKTWNVSELDKKIGYKRKVLSAKSTFSLRKRYCSRKTPKKIRRLSFQKHTAIEHRVLRLLSRFEWNPSQFSKFFCDDKSNRGKNGNGNGKEWVEKTEGKRQIMSWRVWRKYERKRYL